MYGSDDNGPLNCNRFRRTRSNASAVVKWVKAVKAYVMFSTCLQDPNNYYCIFTALQRANFAADDT